MQTINRNNYEEIFLLYIDDELDAASKLEVENFVQHNADLAVEFAMLMQTKSLPDEIIFSDKEILLKTEGNCINEKNYEEYFLLYIDNELGAAKREEVEMYVLQHPKLQNEFTGLKQVVLVPEAISYGEKEHLYRTEKRRRVFMYPFRMAAAAIFIGICACAWWWLQKPVSTITVAEKPVIQIHPKQNTDEIKPVDSSEQIIKPQEKNIAQQSKLPKTENRKTTGTAVVEKKKDNIIYTASSDEKNNNEEQQAVAEHTVITHNNIAKTQKEPPAEIKDIVVAPNNLNQKQNDIATLQTAVNEENNSYKIYPVAYKELNTNDEDNSLRVGVFDLNKDKVKNLFKKAGRLFGNKSNDLANNDGKLQVANFEIGTKKQ
ncbi:MAG: hypothetical protein ABI405_08675 [Parafilimonas sp.]